MLSVVVRAYFPGFVQQVKEVVGGGSAGTAAAMVSEGKSEDGTKTGGNQDPSWLMLLPLVIFAVVIVAVGIHAGPVLRFLALIGGEAG